MPPPAGGRASSLLLEQRVHHEPDRGELGGSAHHHVPGALPHLQGALEPSDPHARLQRPQDDHGHEPGALRRPHGQLQARAFKVGHAVAAGTV